jgi:hypothetical protein
MIITGVSQSVPIIVTDFQIGWIVGISMGAAIWPVVYRISRGKWPW